MKQFPQRLHVGNLAKDKDWTFLLAISPGTAGPGGTPGPEPAWGVAQLARPHTGRGDCQGNPRPLTLTRPRGPRSAKTNTHWLSC